MSEEEWREFVGGTVKKAREIRSARFKRAICKLNIPGQHGVLVQLNCYNPHNENNVEGMWMLMLSKVWMKAVPPDSRFIVDVEKSPYVLVQFENIRTDLDFHGYSGYRLEKDDFADEEILEKIKTYLELQTLDEEQTLEFAQWITDGTLKKHVILYSAVNTTGRPTDNIYYFDKTGAITGILEFRGGNLFRVPIPAKSAMHLNKTMLLTDMDSERYSGLTTRKDCKPFAISSSYENMLSEDFYCGMFYVHEFDVDDFNNYVRKY